MVLIDAGSGGEGGVELKDLPAWELATDAVMSAPWAVILWSLLMLVRGSFTYVRSDGTAGPVTTVKNRVLYGLIGILSAAIAAVIVQVFYSPSLDEFLRGMTVYGILVGPASLILASRSAPTALAAYSAWWMPRGERTTHQQDILYALTQMHWGRRSHHAWGLLKSSPRAGLRARRHHAQLTTAAVSEPIHESLHQGRPQ